MLLNLNYDIHVIIYNYLGQGFHIFSYCSSILNKYVKKYIANYSKENIACIDYFMENIEQFNWLETVCNFDYDQKNITRPMRNIICSIIASKNNFELLKIVHEKGYPCDYYTSSCAAKVGNFEMIKYLYENKCEMDYHTFSNAAVYGHKIILEYLLSSDSNTCEEYKYICNEIAKNGDIELLIYFSNMGFLFEEYAIKNAASMGHVHILQYIHDNHEEIFEYSKYNVEICAAAAAGGHLNCLIYLYDNGFATDRKVSRYAALNGHMHILEFSHNKNLAWDEKTCANASKNGHMKCLTYLRERNCPWSKRAYAYAARNGHYNIIKYLYINGCPYDHSACANAAAGGYLNILKYMRRKKFPWDADTCSNAVSGYHYNILKYAHENKCPWNENTFLQAIINEKICKNNPILLDKIFPIITYLYVNMCPLHCRINNFLELNEHEYYIIRYIPNENENDIKIFLDFNEINFDYINFNSKQEKKSEMKCKNKKKYYKYLYEDFYDFYGHDSECINIYQLALDYEIKYYGY